jgi:hypothetical protein
MLDGREKEIFAERDRRIEAARIRRAEARQAKRSHKTTIESNNLETTSYTESIEAKDRALLGSNSSVASMPLKAVDCERKCDRLNLSNNRHAC